MITRFSCMIRISNIAPFSLVFLLSTLMHQSTQAFALLGDELGESMRRPLNNNQHITPLTNNHAPQDDVENRAETVSGPALSHPDLLTKTIVSYVTLNPPVESTVQKIRKVCTGGLLLSLPAGCLGAALWYMVHLLT